MGNNNRREVAKRLTQEIGVTTDPKTLIELSKQLAKVLPKRRRVSEQKQQKSLRTGSMLDNLSEEERLTHNIVIRAEEIIREAKRQGLPVPTTRQAVEQASSEFE